MGLDIMVNDEQGITTPQTIRRVGYALVGAVIASVIAGILYAMGSAIADLRAEQQKNSVSVEQIKKDFAQFRTDVQLFQSESRTTLSTLSSSLGVVQGLVTATTPKPREKK